MKAKALLKDDTHEVLLLWKDVLVKDYDFEKKLWIIEDFEKNLYHSNRINLVFNSENKKIFAIRFIHAYMDRIYKNSTLKYTFFVKNVPTNDIRPIR